MYLPRLPYVHHGKTPRQKGDPPKRAAVARAAAQIRTTSSSLRDPLLDSLQHFSTFNTSRNHHSQEPSQILFVFQQEAVLKE